MGVLLLFLGWFGFNGDSVLRLDGAAIDRLHIDDPVGAVPVHGVCRVLGTLQVWGAPPRR